MQETIGHYICNRWFLSMGTAGKHHVLPFYFTHQTCIVIFDTFHDYKMRSLESYNKGSTKGNIISFSFGQSTEQTGI